MNKKGFTLIEILVSITLVSIVLVFMLNALVRLKGVYNESDKDTDIILAGALVSRVINNDFIDNNGIRKVECNKNNSESSCNIELNNGEERSLKLRINESKNILDEHTYFINTISTVEYINSKVGNTMFIKSINSKSYYNNDVYVDSDYYHFNDIRYEKKDSGIIIITISANDKRYDVKLYSNSY